MKVQITSQLQIYNSLGGSEFNIPTLSPEKSLFWNNGKTYILIISHLFCHLRSTIPATFSLKNTPNCWPQQWIWLEINLPIKRDHKDELNFIWISWTRGKTTGVDKRSSLSFTSTFCHPLSREIKPWQTKAMGVAPELSTQFRIGTLMLREAWTDQTIRGVCLKEDAGQSSSQL